jgi:hypothetical protein
MLMFNQQLYVKWIFFELLLGNRQTSEHDISLNGDISIGSNNRLSMNTYCLRKCAPGESQRG